MDAFEKMFSTFKESAYRVEALSQYRIEGGEWEEFQKYKEGYIKDYSSLNEWVASLQRWKQEGKEMKRIRVIDSILSDYEKYEFETGYVLTGVSGENIRVVNREIYNQLATPEIKGDYWLFDMKYLLEMKYDQEGRFLGGELVEDEKIVEIHKKLFFELEKHTIPYIEVVKQIRQAEVRVNF
jgi:hypothetical protein